MSEPMTGTFRVGLVQMCTGRDVEKNLADAGALIREAVRQGAQYVQTPEITTLMETDRARLFGAVRPEEGNAAVAHFSALARDLGIWLHLGSMGVLVGNGRIANRSLLFSPAGLVEARFDKIHMFDVQLPGGEVYRESKNYQPGDAAVLAELPWGTLGLTVCYDLRFPHLYQGARQGGGGLPGDPILVYPADGRRPLARADARPCHRERLLRVRGGPGGQARGRPRNLWPQPDRFALGGDPGRGGRGQPWRHRHRRQGKPGAGGARARAVTAARPAISDHPCLGDAGEGSLMILYRLRCKRGHEFEAWFAGSAAFDKQEKRGQLSCPNCGTSSVSKALMAPSVAKRSKRKAAAKKEDDKPAVAEAPKPETQRVAAHHELASAMRKLRAEIESKSEYVGPRFSEEARKIHYEEAPARGIHGEATADEAKALKEEGIEFYPLPILPEDQN